MGGETSDMSKQDATARPGIAPTSRPTAGPMFAALYGERETPVTPARHDAYQLFHQRSLAMGWLDDRPGGDEESAAPGLWGMNDAGWDHPPAAPGADLIAWFQVEASAPADDRPLPVQPFLRCAQEVTERAGAVRLTAVQVLLPVRGIDASARPPHTRVPSLRTQDWFGTGDPGARVPVRVRVDGGLDPSIPAAARQFARALVDQQVFAGTLDEHAGPEGFPAPPFDDRFWNGPPRHGMTLSGELAEWSCDAIGWLAATTADATAALGIAAPVLFTVVRA
ncbi:hypothetical protein [Streptomyces sp. NPDC048659]|uniref:hypothetical protein n=1 Tax=Streptomyces sp. NPDC048659 TaxID=3155489 RepID=UPI0034259C75